MLPPQQPQARHPAQHIVYANHNLFSIITIRYSLSTHQHIEIPSLSFPVCSQTAIGQGFASAKLSSHPCSQNRNAQHEMGGNLNNTIVNSQLLSMNINQTNIVSRPRHTASQPARPASAVLDMKEVNEPFGLIALQNSL